MKGEWDEGYQFVRGRASIASEAKEVGRTNVRCLLLVGGFFLSRFSKNSLKSEFGLSGGLANVAWTAFRKVSGSSC